MTSRKIRSGKSSSNFNRTTRSNDRNNRNRSRDFEKDMLVREDGELQGEYITNLQQQIYFLELELQVMKEKQSNGRFAGKALSTNVPLDTHMNSLRDKYISMEKKFKKKIRKMQEDLEMTNKKNAEFIQKLQREQKNNKELNSQIEILKKNNETIGNSNLAEKLKLENRISKLNTNLDEKTSVYDSVSNKYREYRIESRTEIDELKLKITDLNKEMEILNKKCNQSISNKKKTEIELIESQEKCTLKSEEVLTLKNENFNFKDVVRGWEHKCKKLEMDIQQEQEVSAKYQRENENYRKNILELEQEIADYHKKLNDDHKSNERWSTTIVDLRNEIENLNEKNTFSNCKLNEQSSQISRMTEDEHRLNEQITEMKDKLAQSAEIEEQVNLTLKKLEDSNLDLKKDNIICRDAKNEFDIEKEKLDMKLNEMIEKNAILEIECQNLKQKLNVANHLENINLNEFKTLMSSNLRVADSIKTLMGAMNGNANNNNNNNQENADN